MRTAILLSSCLTLLGCGPAEVPGSPKILLFAASPGNLPSDGGEVTLDWDVTGATTLSVDNGVGSLSPVTKGTVKVKVGSGKTFVLTAINPTGSVEGRVSVTVEAAPAISMTPTARAFVAGNPGGTFDTTVVGSKGLVRWSLVGPGSLNPSTGPSVIYTPPTSLMATTTATLTAAVEGTALSATATVRIAPVGLTGGVLFYKADGSAEVKTVGAAGELTAVRQFNAGELPVGVTHFARPYDLYELFYSAADGSGSLATFDGAGNYRALRTYAAGELPKNQTHLVSLSDRLVMYAAGTATCGAYSSANYDFVIEKTIPSFAINWSVLVPMSAGVLFYRPGGTGALGVFSANCQWAQVTTYSGFSPDWTTIINVGSAVLFYRQSDGVGALVTIAPNGTPAQIGSYLAGVLKKGWDQMINTRFGVLFYNRDGSGQLGTLSGNVYTNKMSYAVGELPVGADLISAVGG